MPRTRLTSSAALDAIVGLVDAGAGAGKVRIYQNGGANPVDADAALGGATLLAELAMSDPAFGAASGSSGGSTTATANAITDDSAADASGTAHFFRVMDSDDNVVFQGEVGTTGSDMNLNSTSISAGATVSITSMTVTLPNE